MRNSLGTGCVKETGWTVAATTLTGAADRPAATLCTLRQSKIETMAQNSTTIATQLPRIHDLFGTETGTNFSGAFSVGERDGGTLIGFSGTALTGARSEERRVG